MKINIAVLLLLPLLGACAIGNQHDYTTEAPGINSSLGGTAAVAAQDRRPYVLTGEKPRPEAAEAGEIVDTEGRVLGRHDGVIHFTVGQRKGIGIAAAEPLYVLRLDAVKRRVVVGPKAALARTAVALRELNWLDAVPIPAEGRSVTVKLRSAQPAVAARIYPGATADTARLDLAMPEYGVAPGQAGVVYDGDRLLGGGWIARPAQTASAGVAA